MNIQNATLNDIDRLSSLVTSLSHFYLSDKAPEWLSATFTPQAFIERIGHAGFFNIVIKEDNEIIAYLSMKDKNHIYHLFVTEHYQGKGLARQLWEHAKQHCKSTHYSVRSSLYAVPVYEKFGFIVEGKPQQKDGASFQAMTWRT